MKNIAICCDGTWNTPDQTDGNVPIPTNVVRLFYALADLDESGNPQHKYYHPGVGTDGSWWDKAVDGGTGRGLDRNIKSAYHELCRYYETGDLIYLFGFSRGAYTVRSLAGLIAHCGLLDIAGLAPKAVWGRIDGLFQHYRSRTSVDGEGWSFHTGSDGTRTIPIWFLGVWDTVGALGVPDDMALLNLLVDRRDHTFHDTSLHPSVATARHAVSLDEMRASFQPTLWTSGPEQDARQVWFPGVHSDVGGGYLEHGLSDGALDWMIGEAKVCGLAFDPGMVAQILPNHLDVLHNSCDGVFTLLPTQPRQAPRLLDDASDIHPSALRRRTTPPISQGPYRTARSLPASLNVFAREPWNATGLWLEAGVEYRFQAHGEWLDDKITCGPEGSRGGKLGLVQLGHLVGDAIGKAETLFKRLTKETDVDFRFTRRHEDAPWFCLMGAIANGGLPDAQGQPAPHETFTIGGGCAYTPLKSGYVFVYANDAWGFYGNNRGHVVLTVEAVTVPADGAVRTDDQLLVDAE